jgi:hypothetical protein
MEENTSILNCPWRHRFTGIVIFRLFITEAQEGHLAKAEDPDNKINPNTGGTDDQIFLPSGPV